GLKTTYYLRALSATSTEKSTLDKGTLNAVSMNSGVESPAEEAAPANDGITAQLMNEDITVAEPAAVPLACSIDNPDCEACQ
ncbi:MAG: hypothetical protein ACE1ZA_08455, partial [Pseudomonadales bacterium]